MRLDGGGAVVTGGASGLGLACTRRLVDRGVPVTVLDLPTADRTALSGFGERVLFRPADVTDDAHVEAGFAAAAERAPVRALIHCAGRGGGVRLLDRDGSPGSLPDFAAIVQVNLIGTYAVLRRAAQVMAANEPLDGERGVCVLTASVAAWEGQIGQIAYAASKAGVVGLTLVAARDLARSLIRVSTIAPGAFDTPILARFDQSVRDKLGAQNPHPSRLGHPDEFAMLALQIIDNPMINGETIRLDGAVRMGPRPS